MLFRVSQISYLQLPVGPGGMMVDTFVDPDVARVPDDPKTKGEFELAPRRKRVGEEDPRECYDVPGPHWEPVDAEAKDLCKYRSVAYTGIVPDVVEDLAKQMEAAQKKAEREEQNASIEAMGKSIGAGIAAAMAAAVGNQQGGRKAA